LASTGWSRKKWNTHTLSGVHIAHDIVRHRNDTDAVSVSHDVDVVRSVNTAYVTCWACVYVSLFLHHTVFVPWSCLWYGHAVYKTIVNTACTSRSERAYDWCLLEVDYWQYGISSGASAAAGVPRTRVQPSRRSGRRGWRWACTVGGWLVAVTGRRSVMPRGTSRRCGPVGSRRLGEQWSLDTGIPPTHRHTSYDHTQWPHQHTPRHGFNPLTPTVAIWVQL